jgi:hypothetical protein
VADVQAFLAMLANARMVSAFANKQALSAVLFVYRVMDGSLVPLI